MPLPKGTKVVLTFLLPSKSGANALSNYHRQHQHHFALALKTPSLHLPSMAVAGRR